MRLAKTYQELKAYRADDAGKSCAFVPTMGSLHAGHLALIAQAAEHAELVWVSIFVNPKQFGPNEDFEAYPREVSADLQQLAGFQNLSVYLPSAAEVFQQDGHASQPLPEFTQWYCGATRPHFFQGVHDVLKALFNQMLPDYVVMGEKDYQQLKLVEWMISCYHYPIRLITAKVFRESTGLAMSSRNQYFSSESRLKAAELYQAMQQASEKLRSMPVSQVLQEARDILRCSGFQVDYLELVHSDTLQALSEVQVSMHLIAAVYLEGVRLIDVLNLKS